MTTSESEKPRAGWQVYNHVVQIIMSVVIKYERIIIGAIYYVLQLITHRNFTNVTLNKL